MMTPKKMRPAPATVSTVATPTLNGSTITNIESNSNKMPPTITIASPGTLNVDISPPREIIMKL